MNIQKNHKTGLIKAQSHFSDDYMNFMYRVIKVHTLITNGEALTNTELMWFCCFINIYNNGIRNHRSEDALQIYKNLLGYENTKENVSNYLTRLKNKGWVEEDGESWTIPELFTKIDINKGQVIDFEIRVTMKK